MTPSTLPDDADGATSFDADVALVVRVTDELLTTVRGLSQEDLAAPSLCDGWTRAHVVAHVARNADALDNLLTWAITGEERPMYASPEERERGIHEGVGRSIADHEADVEASAERFLATCRDAEDCPECYARVVRMASGREVRGGQLPWLRVREVVLHHLDLDCGFTLDHVDDAVVRRLLDDSATALAAKGTAPPVEVVVDGQELVRTGDGPRVEGSARAVLGWLTGRTGAGEVRSSAGEVPVLPPWA